MKTHVGGGASRDGSRGAGRENLHLDEVPSDAEAAGPGTRLEDDGIRRTTGHGKTDTEAAWLSSGDGTGASGPRWRAGQRAGRRRWASWFWECWRPPSCLF